MATHEEKDLPSDESDFYGNNETIQKYKSRIASLAPQHLNQEREAIALSINAISRRSKRSLSAFLEVDQDKNNDSATDDDQTLNNPYEDVPTARQLSEPVETFLERLDPISLDPAYENSHWIWIADFQSPETRRIDSEEEHPKHAEFMKRGLALLEAYRETTLSIESKYEGRSEQFIFGRLSEHRSKLKQDILNAAKQCDITSGKWLLFPPRHLVRQTWSKIAHAVAAHKLGPVAKIAATADEKDRPISVYTRDFSNVEDIKRVLIQLVRLNVTPKEEKRYLYYKCDAYTYLGIMSRNEFGLEASLYSSKQLLSVWKESEAMLEGRKKYGT